MSLTFLSLDFVVFVLLALAACYAASLRARPVVLLSLSYLFYLCGGLWPTVFLAVITVFVYASALWIQRARAQDGKFALACTSVFILVAVLAAFKCERFWANALISKGEGFVGSLLVPLGLSYYLFKAIGYLLDVYWEKLPAQRNVVPVALYLSFFPQILSGPIQRAPDFFRQMANLTGPDPGAITSGLRRILFGVFKKIAIADRIAPAVTQIFGNSGTCSSLELVLGAYLFTIQLYADFSGLTDIAIGLGMLFGIKGPENFNLPFFSRNIQEFWRRWHMSLTSWLGDYLFLPLRMALRNVGNAGLSLAIFANLLAVGLWHGITWGFAVFGALNGFFMVVSVLTLKKRNAFFKRHETLAPWRAVIGPITTFNLIAFSLIFFRSTALSLALNFISHLAPRLHAARPAPWRLDWSYIQLRRGTFLQICVLIVVMEAIHWCSTQRESVNRFVRAPRWQRWALYYAAIAVVAWSIQSSSNFIYARF